MRGAASRTEVTKSSGRAGGYLEGHPLMRVGTSHTHPGIMKDCGGITESSSIEITIRLKKEHEIRATSPWTWLLEKIS